MNVLLFVLVAAVACGIGFFMGRNSLKNDGMFIIDDTSSERTRWILDVAIDPELIKMKKEIRLKVRKMSEEVV